MHPQIKAIVEEFLQARERLTRLTAAVPLDIWGRRPSGDSWSIGECVEHLNLTSRAFLPRIQKGLEEARALPVTAPRRYRRDLAGWLLWRTMGPPVRFRVKTAAPFVPASKPDPEALVRDFEALQREQIYCVETADGLPLSSVRVESPFNQRVRYNLYACLTILPRHQHRHLWQAEEAAKVLGVRATSSIDFSG